MSGRCRTKFDEYADRGALVTLDADGEMCGQAFSTGASKHKLCKAVCYIECTASPIPVVDVIAKLYAATGTVGTNAVPTGSVLAESAEVHVLNGSSSDVTFTFAGYELQANTDYVIVIYNDGAGSGA